MKINKQTLKTWSNSINSEVYYLPILGPVFTPANEKEKLLEKLTQNSSSNFLPYDKNIRWFSRPMEKIISIDEFLNDSVLILTEDNFNNTHRIYFYSKKTIDEKILIKIKNKYNNFLKINNIQKINLYFFSDYKIKRTVITHEIFIKKITQLDSLPQSIDHISIFDKLPESTQNTLTNLGHEEGLGSFSFLHKFLKEKKIGPVFCSVLNNKIVGTIGPMNFSVDICNNKFLLPPYFGVKKSEREKNIGNDLWKTLISVAMDNDALYTLVQNIPDSPASFFYKKQGLKIGSYLHKTII